MTAVTAGDVSGQGQPNEEQRKLSELEEAHAAGAISDEDLEREKKRLRHEAGPGSRMG